VKHQIDLMKFGGLLIYHLHRVICFEDRLADRIRNINGISLNESYRLSV